MTDPISARTPPVLPRADVIARLRAASDGLSFVASHAAKSVAEKAIAQVVGIEEAIRILSEPALSTALAEAREEIAGWKLEIKRWQAVAHGQHLEHAEVLARAEAAEARLREVQVERDKAKAQGRLEVRQELTAAVRRFSDDDSLGMGDLIGVIDEWLIDDEAAVRDREGR